MLCCANLNPHTTWLNARCPNVLILCVTLLGTSCSSGSSDETSLPDDIQAFGLAPLNGEVIGEPNPKTPVIRKVLFIAVDGLRASKLDNTDGARLIIPNFESMQRDGIFVFESHQEKVSDGRYRTCPGFIQMTTGKRIGAHGVKDNKDCREGRFAEFPIFFKRLKQLRPELRIAVAESTKQVFEIILESCGFPLQSCMDDFWPMKQTFEGDTVGKDKVIKWMTDGRYDLIWYHPHEVDKEGHATGWDDYPIDRVVERLDAEIIGPLLKAIATREATTRERWMVITTADHGGHETLFGGNHTTREADKKVPIIVGGTLIPDEGNRGVNAFHTWDLPATIYDYFGVMPSPSWSGTDGRSILSRRNELLTHRSSRHRTAADSASQAGLLEGFSQSSNEGANLLRSPGVRFSRSMARGFELSNNGAGAINRCRDCPQIVPVSRPNRASRTNGSQVARSAK